MAISLVGGANAASANGADVALTFSTAPSANDLIIVAYGVGDDDNVDETMAMITAGYTLVPGCDLFSDDTFDANLGVFYRISDGTETGATVDGLGGVDASVAAAALIFRGVDTSNPFDVAAAVATGQNTGHADPPSIDWATAGVWTVIAGVGATDQALVTVTLPTGYTVNSRTSRANDTTDVYIGMGFNSSPSDPENPGQITHSGVDAITFSWCAVTLALRPAGAGGDQNLTGVLFTKAPTFPQGALEAVYDVTGTTFALAPTFAQGSIQATYELTGTTFTKAPTFPQGTVSQPGAFDPLNLQVIVTGSTAALSWDASTGVTDYAIFRRSPRTGAAFNPLSDTPVATTALTTYNDEGLGTGEYEWQVFGRTVV